MLAVVSSAGCDGGNAVIANPGMCPALAKGKRVRIITVNGRSFEAPADGRGCVDWSKRGSPFDVAEYEIIN